MNMDYRQPQLTRTDQTEATTCLADPMETVLEATARLRVLERLLQHALAAKTATERRSLVRRYNRQRRELLECLAALPTGRTGLPHERPVTTIAGPLRLDSNDQIIGTAVGSIHRLLEQLVIS